MLRQKATLVARIVYFVDLALTTVAFFSAFYLRNLVLPLIAPERFPTGLYPLQEYLKIYPIVLIIWSVLLFTYHSYHSHRTVPLLREALRAKPSLEQRRRIETVLAALVQAPQPLTPEGLRDLRAVSALAR